MTENIVTSNCRDEERTPNLKGPTMTATRPKADLSRAGLLNRLDYRLHELEMDNLKNEITAEEYRSIKMNLKSQIKAIRKFSGLT